MNIGTFGRQGPFTCVNVDNCMKMGFELTDWLSKQRPEGRRKLFADYKPDFNVWF
jgi:hypothetical protein